MTKRDFFIVIVKLFGLFSLVSSLFSGLPTNISWALMDLDVTMAFWIIITFIVIVGLFVLLVFKSDNVVTLLRLDRGFDDDRIELGNLDSKNIVKVAVIIIGGLLFIDSIPMFLSHTLFAFKGDIIGATYDTMDKFNWAVSALNILIGYLLLINYERISNILQSKKSKT